MELPRWAYRPQAVLRSPDRVDIVFTLRPLGRLWLYIRAVGELIWTRTITLSIEFQKGAPLVTHQGEVIEPPAGGSKVTSSNPGPGRD